MSVTYTDSDPNSLVAASSDEQLDPRLIDLLDRHINTFVKWDLIRFFHAQPETADNAETVALATGRDLSDVVPALHEMATSGILDMTVLRNGDEMYILNGDRTLNTQVNSFILACDDDQFRIRAIYHIIRGLRATTSESDDKGRNAL